MPRWRSSAPSSQSRPLHRGTWGVGVAGSRLHCRLGGGKLFQAAQSILSGGYLVGNQEFMVFSMTGTQVWVSYWTLGSAAGLRLGRLFGMCPLPSRATFGLTCCLPSSSSPSSPLGRLSQCQEIVGQR